MSLTLSLSQGIQLRQAHALEIKPDGLLGLQLLATLAFIMSKFDTSLVLEDAVTGEKKPAGSMFEKRGRRWFMVADSLPGDINVKAIGATEASILLETAPVDPKALNELAEQGEVPLRWNDGDAFVFGEVSHACYLHRRQAKAYVDGERILVWRSLWTMPLKGKGNFGTKNAILLADKAVENGLFEEEAIISDRLSPKEDLATDRPAIQRRGVRLNLEFRQQLSLEQVPILCLEGTLEQRMELKGIMALQRRALAMSDDEIANWIAEDPSPDGQRRVLNVLTFAIAGKIKTADPDVTWKTARAAARKLVWTPARP